jgi:virulence factor
MTPAPLRVGLIGAGNIAQIAQLPALAADEGVTIAGVVTRSARSRERNLARWPIERGYAAIGDMLAEAALDAVFVLTPRLDHDEHVGAALDAGLDVFCEKPLATTARRSHELADRAERDGRILQVGFNRRFAEVYRAGRERFGGGHADVCVAQKNRAGSEYRATFENAIHLVDLLRWYCGEAVAVSAHALGHDPYQEDGLCALIRFHTGAVGTLVAARTAGLWDERLDAYGGGQSVTVQAPDSCAVSSGGKTETIRMSPRAYGWVEASEALGFGACVRHFLDRVRDRAAPLTSGREAARTHDLVDEILQAAGLPTVEDPDRSWQSHATR